MTTPRRDPAAVWRLVASALGEAGCGLVTGVPTDEPGLLDAARVVPGLTAVPVRDQRAGACMAAGHALVSGRPAVLAVSSGPPLPNALTGLLEAAALCAPLVVVTTRIPRAGLDRGGFQQVDQRAVTAAVAKSHIVAEDMEQLAWALRHSVHQAVNGVPGVAVVEVTDELLGDAPPGTPFRGGPVRRLRSVPAEDELDRALRVLAEARSPVIVAGGGGKAAGAGPAVRRLAETWGAAVFATAAGRGLIDEEHPAYCGLAGLYATAPAHSLLEAADVVLALGTRLEETVRMGWESLATARLVHVDVDAASLDRGVWPEVALVGDAALTAGLLAAGLDGSGARTRTREWSDRIAAVRAAQHEDAGPGSMARVALRAVRAQFGRDIVLVQENGLHDMWSYHYPLLSLSERSRVVTPGEQTMMGFGVAAAVGAAIAEPSSPTVVVCGDGALTLSLNALPTIAEQGCGITFLVFENGGFGWPRFLRGQEGVDDGLTRFAATAAPPYDDVVRSLGGWTARPRDAQEVEAAVKEAAGRTAGRGLALIAVPVQDRDVPPGVRRVFGEPAGVNR
ncbi:biosynthetic-type acetolactate synthase large subunit [Streptosporangium fragile]|uniref:Biosynthetic-type acetolactate synthase large subunit n=1 Tax=Streptosporangium fragile TaxID=46186 RepID=A0ABN3VQE6_9ACTN